ncbi:MAG TPA: 50S ribosomal protein L5 [Candidatus Babeliales bacterium]|nr:50S ribosomal protein L5 [Candidatus Babeliales bacterium]
MARLQALYQETIKPGLQEELNLKNIMQAPRIVKMVLNVGVKGAVANSKELQEVMTAIDLISGQKSVRRLARKSIAGFKLREGMPIGVSVTLRGQRMFEFLDRLINLALPKVRDFQGVNSISSCDKGGNWNLGIKSADIFPEIVDFDVSKKVYGLNISVHTTAKTAAGTIALLKKFGMPFKVS